MKNELKYQISRSFSRKISLGNYNMADFFASHSEEIPADSPDEKKAEVSERLFSSAKLEVEAAIIEFYKSEERKKELKAEKELTLDLEIQEEEDTREKLLAEANNAFGTK